MCWFKKKSKSNKKIWLTSSLCAVGGAGVALAVALPLTLSKTITLHSLDDVDRYLRKHVIQGPTDRTLGFSDHREFIDYAKNNFSDQFYLNTSLYSLIVLMDNMTSTMGGKTEDESERNASSQELRSSAVSCEIKDIKITKQTKHFQINWTNVLQITLGTDDTQKLNYGIVLDFDRVDSGFILNFWIKTYSIKYSESSVNIIERNMTQTANANSDLFLCVYPTIDNRSVFSEFGFNRMLDAGVGISSGGINSFRYIPISPYDFTNIVWKYTKDVGIPLQSLITNPNLGTITITDPGVSTQTYIMNELMNLNPKLAAYENDVQLRSIHATSAMVVGIEPKVVGVVTITYTIETPPLISLNLSNIQL